MVGLYPFRSLILFLRRRAMGLSRSPMGLSRTPRHSVIHTSVFVPKLEVVERLGSTTWTDIRRVTSDPNIGGTVSPQVASPPHNTHNNLKGCVKIDSTPSKEISRRRRSINYRTSQGPSVFCQTGLLSSPAARRERFHPRCW